MQLDLDRHRREYHVDGATVLPGIIPEDMARRWAESALRAAAECGINQDFRAMEKDVLGDGGEYKYVVIDGDGVRRHLPEMMSHYQAIAWLVSAITLQDVILSPYARSAVNALVYSGGESRQSWHYDTNAISALLYLTTNTEGATECELINDHPQSKDKRLRRVLPQAGSLLLMQGRKVWHRGAPVVNETKISCPWNYYTAGDTWRPADIDNLVYGQQK